MSGGEVTTRSVVTELNAKRCSATGRDEKRPCCRRRRWLVAEESQVASCKSQVTSDLCEIERWMCDDGAVAVAGWFFGWVPCAEETASIESRINAAKQCSS